MSEPQKDSKPENEPEKKRDRRSPTKMLKDALTDADRLIARGSAAQCSLLERKIVVLQDLVREESDEEKRVATAELKTVTAERDALKAEVERLTADAQVQSRSEPGQTLSPVMKKFLENSKNIAPSKELDELAGFLVSRVTSEKKLDIAIRIFKSCSDGVGRLYCQIAGLDYPTLRRYYSSHTSAFAIREFLENAQAETPFTQFVERRLAIEFGEEIDKTPTLTPEPRPRRLGLSHYEEPQKKFVPVSQGSGESSGSDFSFME